MPFVVGGVFFGMGIWGVQHVHSDQRLMTPYPGGMVAVGKVVHVSESCDRGCTYRPTIQYAVRGTDYTFTAGYQDSIPAVGDDVKVSYQTTNPAAGRDVSLPPSSLDLPLFTAYFSACTGGLLLLLGVFGIRRLLRARRLGAIG